MGSLLLLPDEHLIPVIKLICPICGSEFLKTNKASATCSRDCSHRLVKRRPMLGRKPKPRSAAVARAHSVLRENAKAGKRCFPPSKGD